jgi:hypothetical protein
MSYMPAVGAELRADWPDLAAEFDRWGEEGRIARLWWRDDDATAATPSLDRLLHLAEGVPLALAVIPALARPELAGALRRAPLAMVVQHGWRHRNHAAADKKKSEYPPGRQAARVSAELAAGRARLAASFGERALPIFVPPWNRFASDLLPLLAASGIRGLSTMASTEPPPDAGVATIDAHVDLVSWRSGRGFIGTAAALGGMIAGLRAIRTGRSAAPALGILTHHAVMDAAAAAFLDRLTAAVAALPAARWASPAELMP